METWEAKPNALSLAIQSVIQEPEASILPGIFKKKNKQNFICHQELVESAPTTEQEP